MSEVEVAKVKALKTTTLPNGSTLHIVKERDNKLIKRVEVEGVVIHVGKGTPSRKDLVKAISELYGRREDLVVIRSIISKYGVGISRVKAHIYESVERLRYIEPEYILKRHGR